MHALYEYQLGLLSYLCSSGKVRLPVRSSSRVLSGALAFAAAPSGLHHLHHGGAVPAAAGRHALPLQPHRRRALDPETRGRLFRPQHHEPQRDQQNLQVRVKTNKDPLKQNNACFYSRHVPN